MTQSAQVFEYQCFVGATETHIYAAGTSECLARIAYRLRIRMMRLRLMKEAGVSVLLVKYIERQLVLRQGLRLLEISAYIVVLGPSYYEVQTL